jgi:hypothetical protein
MGWGQMTKNFNSNQRVGSQWDSVFDHMVDEAADFCSFTQREFNLDYVSIKASESKELRERFSRLSVENQQAKLNLLKSYNKLIQQMHGNGTNLEHPTESAKEYLERFDLVVGGEDEVWNRVKDGDYIEIYDVDSVQMFRSLNFLKATSHSLVRLCSLEWIELFKRSEHLTETILGHFNALCDGRRTEPVFDPVPPHTVKEIGVPLPRSTQSVTKTLAPVVDKNTGHLSGCLHLFGIDSARVLDFSVC